MLFLENLIVEVNWLSHKVAFHNNKNYKIESFLSLKDVIISFIHHRKAMQSSSQRPLLPLHSFSCGISFLSSLTEVKFIYHTIDHIKSAIQWVLVSLLDTINQWHRSHLYPSQYCPVFRVNLHLDLTPCKLGSITFLSHCTYLFWLQHISTLIQ